MQKIPDCSLSVRRIAGFQLETSNIDLNSSGWCSCRRHSSMQPSSLASRRLTKAKGRTRFNSTQILYAPSFTVPLDAHRCHEPGACRFRRCAQRSQLNCTAPDGGASAAVPPDDDDVIIPTRGSRLSEFLESNQAAAQHGAPGPGPSTANPERATSENLSQNPFPPSETDVSETSGPDSGAAGTSTSQEPNPTPAVLSGDDLHQYEQQVQALSRILGLSMPQVIDMAQRHPPMLQRSPMSVNSVVIALTSILSVTKDEVNELVRRKPALLDTDPGVVDHTLEDMSSALGISYGKVRAQHVSHFLRGFEQLMPHFIDVLSNFQYWQPDRLS